MTTTRVHPTDDVLDILHPDTNAYVRAVALLQVAGGLNVGLVPLQQALLNDIAGNADLIGSLLAEAQGSNNSLNAVESLANAIQTLLQNGTNPSLVSVNTNLAALQATDTNILAKLETIRQLNDTISTGLASISTRTLDYTNTLASILTAIVAVNTSLAAAKDPVTAVLSKATLDTSDQEVAIALPANTRLLMFRCRRNGTGVAQDIRYAFTNNQVGNIASGNYRILEAYNEYRERLGGFTGSLYVACTAAAVGTPVTIEVEAWS